MNKFMTRVTQSVASLALGLSVAVAATSVQAAVSFPNYPLQTGSGLVPPNIMFILDNSGSMAETNMKRPGVPNLRLGSKALTVNSLSYDPTVTYMPWAKVDVSGQPIVETGGVTYSSAYSNDSNATAPINIGDSVESVFYLLRSPLEGNSSAHYDRYRIDGSGNIRKASVITVDDTTSQPDIYFPAVLAEEYSSAASISVGADKAKIRLTLSPNTCNGSSCPRIYATMDGSTPGVSGANHVCRNSTSCDFDIIGPATVKVAIYAENDVSAVATTVSTSFLTLGAETLALPTRSTRTNAGESQNIATWYSFHRTRMKAAKAGASAAFIGLGSGYRVGFDTINLDGEANTAIRTPIPVDINRGLFEGANKKAWYDMLLTQSADGWTPLRSALKRAGEYYSTETPWTDGTGTAEQSCRASYAVLTTDGYWNKDDDFTIGTGDVDGDGWSNTLADVAAHYWKTDLRSVLDNNVPTNAKDPADWQHMSLFSVSIGQQGSLPITTPPPSVWPDPTDAEDNHRIDDLWHAAVNGRGPNMIVASQSESFKNALVAALNTVKEQRASGSNITANGNSLNNGAQIFQAMYSMPSWTGNVLAYAITNAGIASTPQWSLADVADADSDNFKLRPVYTSIDGVGRVFNSTNNPGVVGRSAGNAIVTVEDNIKYLKGEQGLEVKNGGKLRDRASPIGDIVNSSPFYERQLTSVFIGANDGMLHGIDSGTGKVLFSYMPAGIDWAKLSDLSDPTYSEGSAKHLFSVDGQMDVSDTTQGDGRNILASGLGRGGRGIFGLDVTSINTHDVDGDFTGTFGAANIKFDETGVADNDMGYVLAQPQVRLLQDGQNNTSTAIITGNGVDSVNGEAVLYIYKTDGTVWAKIPTGAKTGNGLSQTSVADLTSDGIVDTIYAGDLLGNVWKFDVRDKDSKKWNVTKLFTAKNAGGGVQPITGGITAAREPDTGNVFLVFGTGQLLSTRDLVSSAPQATQTIYGLIDSSALIAGRASLQSRSFQYSGNDSKGRRARGLENYSTLPSGKSGWYIDLANNADAWARGERVVTSPTLNGRAAWISSIIPLLGAGCNNAGRGFLNAVDFFTGTNPAAGTGGSPASGSFFDVDGNGKGDDKVGQGYVSSVDLGVAMPGAPAIVDTKIVVNGSNAQVASMDVTSGTPSSYRLMWRELINLE